MDGVWSGGGDVCGGGCKRTKGVRTGTQAKVDEIVGHAQYMENTRKVETQSKMKKRAT